MKTLTKISILAVGLAAASLPTFAADAAAPAPAPAGKHQHLRAKLAERRGKIRAHVAKRLDLTADQKTQLKAKRDELKQSLQAIRNDSSLTKEQKHAKARELLQSERGQMRSVLTADQQKKLDAMRAKLAKHRKDRLGKKTL